MNLQLIKSLAKDNKISIRDLSQRIGMSEQGLHRSIRTNSIAAEYLENIAQCLGVPVGVFYGEKTHKDANKVSAKIFKHYVETFLGIIQRYIEHSLCYPDNKKVSNISELKKYIKDRKKQDTEFAYMSDLIINKWKLTEDDFSELQKAGVITKEQSILKLWARSGYDIEKFTYIYIGITAKKEISYFQDVIMGKKDLPSNLPDRDWGIVAEHIDELDDDAHPIFVQDSTNKYDEAQKTINELKKHINELEEELEMQNNWNKINEELDQELIQQLNKM